MNSDILPDTLMQTARPAKATLKALNTPELLLQIIGYLTAKEIRRSAYTVSSLWNEISRDIVWKNVEDAGELFNALVRLTPDRDRFSSMPTRDDWESFERRVAKRVRRIYLSQHAFTRQMADVVYRSPFISKPVLKNIECIRWAVPGRVRDALGSAVHLLFMHPGLQRCDLEELQTPFIMNSYYPFPVFMREVATRAPNIRSLAVSASAFPQGEVTGASILDGALSTVLPMLPSLRTLRVPLCAFTERLLMAAAASSVLETLLPNPGQVDARKPWKGRTAIATLVRPEFHRVPTIPLDAFKSLTALQLCASLLDAAQLLSAGHPFVSSLMDFRLRVLEPSKNDEVNALTSAIANHARRLQHLTIAFHPPFIPYDPYVVPDAWRGDGINEHGLGPLSGASQLLTLHIVHAVPLALSDTALVQLLLPLSLLQDVSLVSEPNWIVGVGFEDLFPPHTPITIAALADIMNTHRRLERIGLYVDFMEGVPDEDKLPALQGRYALCELDLGTTGFPADFPSCPPTPSSQFSDHDDAQAQLDRLAMFLYEAICMGVDHCDIIHFGSGRNRRICSGMDDPDYSDCLSGEVRRRWEPVYDAISRFDA
ncbi:hypothetical protein PENSPDRAFT_668703 [Peniophora sp. CONT]|nr:hypothetical protein PENSPDRAFT_668703 [Peniophora sp. CONT]